MTPRSVKRATILDDRRMYRSWRKRTRMKRKRIAVRDEHIRAEVARQLRGTPAGQPEEVPFSAETVRQAVEQLRTDSLDPVKRAARHAAWVAEEEALIREWNELTEEEQQEVKRRLWW